MNTHEVIRSGQVRRWHSNPDLAHTRQTNAEHQWNCAVMAMAIFPDDTDLLKECLLHDCGEVDVGDMSGFAKAANPKLKKALDVSERAKFEELGIPYYSFNLKRKFIDTMDAYRWAKANAPHRLHTDGWPDALEFIWSAARKFNVPYFCVKDILG